MATETRRLQTKGKFALTLDDTLTTQGSAADAKATGDRLAELENSIADILYKAISITSLTNNVGTVEMGATVTAITFAWGFNKTPTSITFNGVKMDSDSIGTTLTGLNITKDSVGKSWTLSATDERNVTATKSTSISFLNGVYYGALEEGTNIDSISIKTLNKKLQSGRAVTFTETPGITRRLTYAIPTRYGTPSFNIGGFDYVWNKVATISFLNASDYAESYDIWQHPQLTAGSVTVKVS